MSKSGGNGKLAGRLRCILRRWHSSGGITRSSAGGASSGSTAQEEEAAVAAWPHHAASFHCGDVIPPGLHPVYVGKSRRRYLVSSELVGHPLFRVLVERTGSGGGDAGSTVVGCEVVLFEHLLWMLENADPQPESLDELVDYYS